MEEEIITKKCTRCNEIKLLTEYFKGRNICKKCVNIGIKLNKNTENGFLGNLTREASKSAKTRAKKDRIEAGICTITSKDVKDLWKEQNGLCYYSGIPMKTKQFSSWQCSLERLNPSLGYTKENIVLCCCELNDSSQWSHEKIKEMIELNKNNTPVTLFDFTKPNRKPKIRETVTKTIVEIDGKMVEHYNCNHCKKVKPITSFCKNINIGCNECCALRSKRRMTNAYEYIQIRLASARQSCKKRPDKIIRKTREYTYDIDMEFIEQQYKKQNGLCYYSDIPLTLDETNWKMSFERLDSSIGYTKENVVLICKEFNTSDKTCMNNEEECEVLGWNKEKFTYFLQNYEKNMEVFYK